MFSDWGSCRPVYLLKCGILVRFVFTGIFYYQLKKIILNDIRLNRSVHMTMCYGIIELEAQQYSKSFAMCSGSGTLNTVNAVLLICGVVAAALTVVAIAIIIFASAR